jgi:hypothetical protein
MPLRNNPSYKNEEGLNVSVEYTGLGRAIAGEKRTRLSLPRGTDYHGVVRRLAELFPGLVGVVIAPNREELLNANLISRNGEEMIMPDMLDQCPQDGDTLTLLSIIVGG